MIIVVFTCNQQENTLLAHSRKMKKINFCMEIRCICKPYVRGEAARLARLASEVRSAPSLVPHSEERLPRCAALTIMPRP